MNSTLCSSSLEPLEDRIAPAGIVTVTQIAPGEFTLTGDLFDNDISIFQTGPGSFRIQGLNATSLNPGTVEAMDFSKLTKVTFVGGAGSDEFTITNVSTLTSLSLDGGNGSDIFVGINVAVKGNVEINCGASGDGVAFSGVTNKIGGNLIINDDLDGTQIEISARKTIIGGSLIVNGGTGQEVLFISSPGTLNVGKGIDFDAGASGGGQVTLDARTSQTIGKLPTGESILFHAGADTGGIALSGGDSILTGGLRFVGSPQMDVLQLGSPGHSLKIGKLPTGESLAIDVGTGQCGVTIIGSNLVFAGGIDFTAGAGAGANSLVISSPNGKVAVGKLSTGHSIHYTGAIDTDSLSMDASILKLAGGVEMAAGAGTNVFTLGAPGGRATFGKLPSGASLKMSGGPGNDSISLNSASAVFAGGIDFTAGDGANIISENSSSGSFKIGKLSDGASIRYAGGAGSDGIATDSASLILAGGLDFSGGAGTSSVVLFGLEGKLIVGRLATGQSVKYAGGVDGDTFTTNYASATFAGGLELLPGDGSNFFNFNGNNGSLKIGKLADGQSIRYMGGAGGDALASTQANILMAGGVEFSGGDGAGFVGFDNNGILRIGTIATGQSILYTAGNNSDTLNLGGVRAEFKGALEMIGGNGPNTIDLAGNCKVGKSTAGASLLLTGGANTDRIILQENITLAGSLALTGAAGNDLLDLSVLGLFKAVGPINFNGGPDDDTFNLRTYTLSLAQGINFTGDTGADDFFLRADGSILGDVTVDLGSDVAGIQDFVVNGLSGLIRALNLKGKLTVTSIGPAASTELLNLTNVSVAKDLSLSFGASASFVTIDNLFAGGALTIDTGAGNDLVSFEGNNFLGNSTVAKLATILTGAGNDVVSIGSVVPPPNGGLADSTRVRFFGGLTLDGGADTDTRNGIDTQNDFPGGAPTGLATFEVIVP